MIHKILELKDQGVFKVHLGGFKIALKGLLDETTAAREKGVEAKISG